MEMLGESPRPDLFLPPMIYTFGRFELDLATVELRAGGKTIERGAAGLCTCSRCWSRTASASSQRTRSSKKSGTVASFRTQPWRAASSRRGRRSAMTASRSNSSRRSTARGIASSRRPELHRDVAAGPRVAAARDSVEPSLGAMVQRLERISRPSLAVLPFRLVAGDERYAALAHALPDELIADLARLHWLFVTARGLVVPLACLRDRFRRYRAAAACPLLPVGHDRSLWARNSSSSSSSSTPTNGGIVWADRFSGRIDDVHAMREQIRSQVLAALEIRIPMHEANRARLAAVENLDAWSAYHLALQHLYRFNRVDNAAAAGLFERAVALDPDFRPRARRLVLRPFPDGIHALHGRPRRCDRPGAPFRRARVRTRSPRSVRQLHDGTHLLARGRSRQQPGLARALDGHQSALCSGHLRTRVDRGTRRARRSMAGSTSTLRCD